ncbi:MAG: phospho-sugar mutase [Clostridia bacterium]|nr:phospho-sugar mutase [Clostridia bacterium]
MDINEKYNVWVKNIKNEELLKDLNSIESNEKEKYERFYKNLEFGTAGIRGIMRCGANGINIYTIRQTAQGLANYLLKSCQHPVVVISYDSRNNSYLFAKETASVLAANNVKVYISSSLQPTPFLSFAVRFLKADAGVMITASHNPAEYNGFKCYGSDGAQMGEEDALKVYNCILHADIFKDVKYASFNLSLESGQIKFIAEDVYQEYIKCVLAQRINKDVDMSQIKIVYTPLSGAGKNFVKTVFELSGAKNLIIVPEQEKPDGNFSTCPKPNPELKEAFKYGEMYAQKNNADIIIATDPDADRLGVCVKNGGEFRLLTGNEIGVILFNYIISCKKEKLSSQSVLIKSLVSTPLVNEIAEKNNCKVKEVLTGFKNIAAEILKMEKNNNLSDYLFGFEESNGYLLGTYARDKDAVSAALLICETAGYYKSIGKDFNDVLNELGEKYGFFKEETLSFEFKGSEGIIKIKNIMDDIRKNPGGFFGEFNTFEIEDYLNSTVNNFENNELSQVKLPKSNILKYKFKNGSSVIIRPSGTEPKIKFYILVQEKTENAALDLLKNIKYSILYIIKKYEK